MELKKICCIATVTAAALMAGCGPKPKPDILPPPAPAYSDVTFPVWPVFTELPMQAERRGNCQ